MIDNFELYSAAVINKNQSIENDLLVKKAFLLMNYCLLSKKELSVEQIHETNGLTLKRVKYTHFFRAQSKSIRVEMFTFFIEFFILKYFYFQWLQIDSFFL